jgi:hypothetical protein
MSSDEFKKLSQRRNKKFIKQSNLHEIAATFTQISNDILLQAYKDQITESNAEHQCDKLRIYINQCFVATLQEFNSKKYLFIDTKWDNILLNT